MKDLRLKVSQTELKGLYNLTEMYIAGWLDNKTTKENNK